MNLLSKYKNGNVTVTLLSDGTKIQEWSDDETPNPTFPVSCDVKITDWCDAGCKFCLHPDSLISTISGDIKISDIEISTIVYTLNESTGNLEINQVEDVIISDFDGELIELSIDDSKVLLTPNHKVFTQDRGWILAENLLLTDNILKF